MRICRLCRPELRLAGNPLDLADRVQVREVSERQRQQPLGVLAGERLAEHPLDDLEGGHALACEADRDGGELLAHQSAVALDMRVYVGEGAPVPGQAQSRAEPLDDVE